MHIDWRDSWFSVLIIGLLVSVFILQLLFPVLPAKALTPHITTLIAMGGLGQQIVQELDQPFRLLTSALLHADPIHLMMNGFALFFGLKILHSIIGYAWTLCVLLLGTIGASWTSMAFNDPHTVAVGASGGIMALFGAILVLGYFLKADPTIRQQLHGIVLRVALPSLLPIGGMMGINVDYSAHMGGFVAGILIMWFSTLVMRALTRARLDGLWILRTIATVLILWLGYGEIQIYKDYDWLASELRLSATQESRGKAGDDTQAR
ncbi:MAG: rhomboid family intramembrane serine protease [Holosporales bacterium]